MEKIAQITGVLCTTVFVIGVFYQLGCLEKTARIIRFITAICIISLIFKSISDINFMPSIYSADIGEYNFQDNFCSSVIYETQNELEEIIKKRLDEKNISYNFVQVHILEQNGNLTADKIVVSCDKKYADAVYSCIGDIATENTKINIGE